MAAVSGRLTGYGGQVLDGRFDGPQPRLRKFVIPDTARTINLRDGSVGFILIHFALWWHEVVHRLDLGTWDEWGWASRPVRGQSVVISEHAGGRAEDLDATQHPRGVAILRTFKKWQIAKIHARLLLYRVWSGKKLVRVLDWGGDYRHTVDGMHVEIAPGVTIAMAERLAGFLMKTPRGKRILAANPGLREVIES
jgi:hypothetical protein